MRAAGIAVATFVVLLNTLAIAQTGRDGQDCAALRKQAAELCPKDALALAHHKGIPPANKVYPEAKISWTVLVNHDGFIECVLDNSPAESWGRLHLMINTAKVLEDWRFKPYAFGGKKRPFITKLTFFDDGKQVTVE